MSGETPEINDVGRSIIPRIRIITKGDGDLEINLEVGGSRMRWGGHGQRMGEERLPKRAWDAGEKDRGRREDRGSGGKTAWKEICMRTGGMKSHEWVILAEERGAWKELTREEEEAASVTKPQPAGIKGRRKRRNKL